MSTLNNRIKRGNAADVQQRGVNVLITPEEVTGGGSTTEELVVLRLGGLDVVNGKEAPNPNNLGPNDTGFIGWTIAKYICAINACTLEDESVFPELFDNIEIVNLLTPGWTNAYLTVNISHDGTYPGEAFYEVTSATISSTASSTDYLTVHFDEYDLSMTFPNPSGTYCIQLATTVGGEKIMTSCLHTVPEVWKQFKDIEAVGEVDSSSPPYFNIRLTPIILDLAMLEGGYLLSASAGGQFSFAIKTV